MTKFKTSDRNDQTMRVLDNVELDAVVGGGLDNCLPGRTIIIGTAPNTGWTFKDVFAHPTLGTYH
jgi:hypothetical protein